MPVHICTPLLDSYDPSKENEYIIYLDANNWYGWAMSQSLPVEKFKWADIPEDFDVMSFPEEGPQEIFWKLVQVSMCL